jgi:serine/threonine protein kinase
MIDRFGRYQISEEIHSGVVSNLYKAVDTSQNQTVALKILKEEYSYDNELVQRFEREAKVSKELAHPNIIKVYDIGCEDHRHYFTMQYITGPSLRRMIETEGRMSFEKTGIIIKTACLALHHAHTKHVFHRDIKPSNIMIDDNGNIIILDFGIAKIMFLARLTRPGFLLGTPEYMSPEQIKGTLVDGRTDLYSLGVVMYELLTGTVPFKGNTEIEIAEKIVKNIPLKPSDINNKITHEIDAIIFKAIDKDRTKRFNNGVEMANAINRTLGLPEEKIQVEPYKTPAVIPTKKKIISPVLSPRTAPAIFTKHKSSASGMQFWLPPVISIGVLLIILTLIYKRTAFTPVILIVIGLIALLLVVFVKPVKDIRYIDARLLLITGNELLQEFPLNTRQITIGRDQPEGIELFKDTISRAHAQITNDDGYFIISDLNSTNGTLVNEKRITSCILKNGDCINIGGVILIFQGIR